MPIKELSVTINRKMVMKFLRYKNESEIPTKILARIENCLEVAKELLEPRVCFEKFVIHLDEKNRKLLLPRGYYIDSEYIYNDLHACESLVLAIATIGESLEKKARACFLANEYIDGMIFDVIGTTALTGLSCNFWCHLIADAKVNKLGITHRYSPGEKGWLLKDQKLICELLKAGQIGITLTDNYMMVPLKSVSKVYGLATGLGISKVDHDCSLCGLTDCIYRKEQDNET